MALISQMGASNCIRSDMGTSFQNVRKAVLLDFCSPDIYYRPYGLKRGGGKVSCVSGAGVGSKRGKSLIVAASPPTEDVVVSTEPLTKKDLVDYLASGCKPKENWRIGTEHEKFGFEIDSLRPIKYEQIAELLHGIAERFDWEKIMEGDNIIGLKQAGQD